MSNIGFNCDVCGRQVQGCTFVNGMKFCAKCYQETFGNTSVMQMCADEIAGYLKRITDLEAKLAESEEEIKIVREQNGRVIEKLDLIVRSNQDLEKQLAEKEKKLQKWINGYFASPTNQPVLTTSQHITQDKIDFAIEQIQKAWDMFSKEYFDNEKMETLGTRFLARLDQQIKELRGENV